MRSFLYVIWAVVKCVASLVVLELRSKEEAAAFVKEKKGTLFKTNTICVSHLEPRLKLLSYKYNTHVTSHQTGECTNCMYAVFDGRQVLCRDILI